MPGGGGDHIATEANGARRAELEEYEHVPAQEREECDTRTAVAALDPTVRIIHVTRANITEYGATEECQGCNGIAMDRSMPHNNECRMRIRTSMEQDEDDGRVGWKKQQQRQDRHLEKVVARSVEKFSTQAGPRSGTSEILWRLRTMMVQKEVRQKEK